MPGCRGSLIKACSKTLLAINIRLGWISESKALCFATFNKDRPHHTRISVTLMKLSDKLVIEERKAFSPHWLVFLNEIRILIRKKLTLEIRRDVEGHFVAVNLETEDSQRRFQVSRYVQ